MLMVEEPIGWIHVNKTFGHLLNGGIILVFISPYSHKTSFLRGGKISLCQQWLPRYQNTNAALAVWLSWLAHCAIDPKVTGSIPSQNTYKMAAKWRLSLTLMYVSLSPPPSSLLKSNEICPLEVGHAAVPLSWCQCAPQRGPHGQASIMWAINTLSGNWAMPDRQMSFQKSSLPLS